MKANYTKQILMMRYVEYNNTFVKFVNKYNIPSVNISPTTFFKNELGNAQIVTMG
jgi:hypothetical protein